MSIGQYRHLCHSFPELSSVSLDFRSLYVSKNFFPISIFMLLSHSLYFHHLFWFPFMSFLILFFILIFFTFSSISWLEPLVFTNKACVFIDPLSVIFTFLFGALRFSGHGFWPLIDVDGLQLIFQLGGNGTGIRLRFPFHQSTPASTKILAEALRKPRPVRRQTVYKGIL